MLCRPHDGKIKKKKSSKKQVDLGKLKQNDIEKAHSGNSAEDLSFTPPKRELKQQQGGRAIMDATVTPEQNATQDNRKKIVDLVITSVTVGLPESPQKTELEKQGKREKKVADAKTTTAGDSKVIPSSDNADMALIGSLQNLSLQSQTDRKKDRNRAIVDVTSTPEKKRLENAEVKKQGKREKKVADAKTTTAGDSKVIPSSDDADMALIGSLQNLSLQSQTDRNKTRNRAIVDVTSTPEKKRLEEACRPTIRGSSSSHTNVLPRAPKSTVQRTQQQPKEETEQRKAETERTKPETAAAAAVVVSTTQEDSRDDDDDEDEDSLISGLERVRLEPDQTTTTVQLRDYQQRLVREFQVIVNSHQDQVIVNSPQDEDGAGPTPPRVLLYLPTGGGKTMVAAHILRWACTRKSWKCLFVVNRDVLVDQTYRSLERLGVAEKVGFLRGGGGGSSFEESKSIYIASIQYLRQRGAVLPAARVVVIDEAHCMLAKSYTELVGSYAGSIFLGMTATPFRTKAEEKLGLIFNRFICGPSVNELVHRDILVKPIMYIEPLPKAKTDTEDAMAKTVAAFSKYCQAGRRRTICFCKTVQHAHALSDKFNAAGIAAACVDGHTKADEREAIFARFAQGACQVLTSVDVLSEGFDEPRVSAVMLLRATDSKGLYIQQVGRGLRSCSCALGKKEDCLVIDMAGNIQKHGAVTGPRQYSLEGAPAAAAAALVFSTAQQKKKQKKFEPVRRCSNPSCGTWMHYQVEDSQRTLTLIPLHP